MKDMILKKDLVIKKGTVFKCIAGMTIRFAAGNHQALVADGKDHVIRVTVESESRKLKTVK